MSLDARVLVRRPGFTLDVDVVVPAGQVVAVLGPNGAGKSTLLRALAGLVPLDSGAVELAGRPLEEPAAGLRLPPDQRRVGVVFQDLRLFARLSARENVAFGPRSTGTPRAAARAAADAWLERLGLRELADRRPPTLSGGQAQRVALARALAAGPDLLLLDEPLSALDAGTRDDVRAALRAQLAGFAGPALVVTHDLVDALTLADRVLVLAGGQVVQDDLPRAMLARPRTPYVAQLVGLTLWSGTAAGGVLHLDDEHGGARLPLADRALAGRVQAVVRPGAVRVGPPGQVQPPPGDGRTATWTASVRSVEGLADRVRIRLGGTGADGGAGGRAGTGAEGPPLVADVDAVRAADLPLQAGARLAVTLAAADVTAWPVVGASAPAPRG